MKKFFAIALIAASFVACNEGEKTTTETVNQDSINAVKTADSIAEAAKAQADTAKNVADSASNAANAVADSVKK
ncbi:MAG: hypothetical protein H7Y86_18535 [Rhizobacter sp.]|nr:hypothetical protein [Ferruginibacter sp.]